MTTYRPSPIVGHPLHARDIWWTLDSANAFVSNSREICLSMRELKVRGRVKIACGMREI